MNLLSEKDRALANQLLHNPEVLREICDEAATSDAAVRQLQSAMWLFATLVDHLERALAFAAVPDSPMEPESEFHVETFGPGDEYERWTLAEHAEQPAH